MTNRLRFKHLLLLLLLSFPYNLLAQEPSEKTSYPIKAVNGGCRKIVITENGEDLRPYIYYKDKKIHLYDLSVSKYGQFHYCYSEDHDAELIIPTHDKQLFDAEISVVYGFEALAEKIYSESIKIKNKPAEDNVLARKIATFIFKYINKPTRFAETLTLAAKISARKHGLKTAAKLYVLAFKAWSNTKNNRMIAITQNDRGRNYHYLGEFKKEYSILESALQFAKKTNDKRLIAIIKNNICLNQHDSGKFDLAYQCYLEVLDISEEIMDLTRRAKTKNNIGGYFSDIGEPKSAITWLEKSFEDYAATEDIGGQAVAKTNISIRLIEMGEYQKAIQYLVEARDQFVSLEKNYQRNYKNRQGWVYTILGSAYHHLGSFEDTQYHYDQAIQYLSDQEGKPTEFKSWLSAQYGLIDLLKARGELQQAQTKLLSLESTVNESNSNILKSKFLRALSQTYLENQEAKKAEQSALKALDMAGKIESHSLIASIEILLGDIYIDSNPQDAMSYYSSALSFFEGVDPKNSSWIHLKLGHILFKQKKFDLARKQLDQALDSVTLLSQGIVDYELKSWMLSTWKALIDLRIQLALSDLQKEHKQRIDEAFQIAGLLRAKSSQGFNQNTINERLKNIYKKISIKLNIRLRLLEENPKSAIITKLTKNIKQLQSEARNYRSNSQSNSNIGFNFISHLIKPEDIDEDTILMRFWLGPSASYLWFASQNRIDMITLPSQEVIEESLTQTITALKVPGHSQLKNRIKNTSKLLKVDSWPEFLNKRNVYIESNGLLNLFPLDVLELSISSEKRPFDDIALKYGESFIRSEQKKKNQPWQIKDIEKIIVFSDPITSASDSRLSNNTTGSTTRNKKVYRQASKKLGRLMGTQQESLSIKKTFPKKTTIHTGFEATKDLFLKESKNANILHIASHGFYDPKLTNFNSIVFSRYDPNGRQLDGLLHFSDISQLKIKSNLVVLSACETALGQNVGGQEVLNLPKAFVKAGAQQVIATLWPVNDKATEKFMSFFYVNLAIPDTTPQEALVKAKNNMKYNLKYKSPHYWSAFTFID
ncbi:CHAT domain-containing protein [Marinicella sp. W31]|uniref:CHAT domain-containing protein n=1 Tax=Marinicella sp. W31 TaxID=3023713 RepID=UPI0037569C40